MGTLAHQIPEDLIPGMFDRATLAADLLAIGAGPRNSLYSIRKRGSGNEPVIVVNQWPRLNKHEAFGDYLSWINETLFSPPLIEPPRPVTDNRNAGYHTFKLPVLLGRYTQHDMDLNLEPLNILNALDWTLDTELTQVPHASVAQSLQWSIPDELEHMPSGVPSELAQRHVQDSRKVYQLYQSASNTNSGASAPLYFAWQYDSRGRLYNHGHHIHFQSHEFKKAMLNINISEKLT